MSAAPRRRASAVLAVTAGVMVVGVFACQERVSTLRLIVGLDGDSPRGLVCRQEDDPSKRMVERGLERGVASIVVDFVRLNGTPGCRISELLAWCQDEPCTPILEHRACIEIDLTDVSLDDLPATLADAIDGRVVAADAPAEPVLIRTIAVAQPCAEIPGVGDAGGPDVDCDQLMGCLYTCPVTLGRAEGDIVLDLDVIGEDCEPEVNVCASSTGFAVDEPCGL